jgi:ClpP class serine protease
MEEIREVGNASSSSSQPEAVSSAHSPLNKTAVNPNESHGSTAAPLPALTTPRPRAYVVTLKGDMFLSQGAYLTSVVSFLLETARSGPGGDELVLLLESGGGAAYEYGLSAAQLERLRRAGIRLTVCVDKIAASGGYMLAVVADTLVTAPFATIGSIGATTSVPVLNVGVALKRLGIHAYSIKAGKHKGSGGMLLVGDAKGDQEALGKLREDLAKVHEAFKAHIGRWRKMVDVEAVGTGEVWQGREAKALGLVDEIMTSEEYLAWRLFTHDVVKVSPAPDARRFPGSFFLPGGGGGGRGGGAPLGPTAAMAVLTSIREMIARRGVKRIGGVLVDEEEKAGVSVADRVLHSVASLLLGQKAPLIIC